MVLVTWPLTCYTHDRYTHFNAKICCHIIPHWFVFTPETKNWKWNFIFNFFEHDLKNKAKIRNQNFQQTSFKSLWSKKTCPPLLLSVCIINCFNLNTLNTKSFCMNPQRNKQTKGVDIIIFHIFAFWFLASHQEKRRTFRFFNPLGHVDVYFPLIADEHHI